MVKTAIAGLIYESLVRLCRMRLATTPDNAKQQLDFTKRYPTSLLISLIDADGKSNVSRRWRLIQLRASA